MSEILSPATSSIAQGRTAAQPPTGPGGTHAGAPVHETEDDRVTALNDQLLSYARDLRGALARTRSTADELSRTHLETVAALAAAIDVRDEVTGGHVYRVANYGLVLAQHVAPDLASDPQLVYGFLLHDIGKLAVPDGVLLKEGPLNAEERAVMRSHVQFGVRFIEQVSFLKPALHVVATHHEAWDGSGYPRGLSGEDIPLATRLFGPCDAFDAMIHDRPYRRGMRPEAAMAELRACAGTQFDPEVVAGFEEILPDILAVGRRPELPDVSLSAPGRRSRDLGLSGSIVFDALDDALLLISPEGVVHDANARFLEWFGLSRAPVGMTLAELVDRLADRFEDPATARSQAARLQRELLRADSEHTYRIVSPQPRTVHRVARTLYDDSRRVVGRLLIFRDVTV